VGRKEKERIERKIGEIADDKFNFNLVYKEKMREPHKHDEMSDAQKAQF